MDNSILDAFPSMPSLKALYRPAIPRAFFNLTARYHFNVGPDPGHRHPSGTASSSSTPSLPARGTTPLTLSMTHAKIQLARIASGQPFFYDPNCQLCQRWNQNTSTSEKNAIIQLLDKRMLDQEDGESNIHPRKTDSVKASETDEPRKKTLGVNRFPLLEKVVIQRVLCLEGMSVNDESSVHGRSGFDTPVDPFPLTQIEIWENRRDVSIWTIRQQPIIDNDDDNGIKMEEVDRDYRFWSSRQIAVPLHCDSEDAIKEKLLSPWDL